MLGKVQISRDMRVKSEILRDMHVKSWLNDPFLMGFHVRCAQIFTKIGQLGQILRDVRVKSADSRDMHAKPEHNLPVSLSIVDRRWRYSVGCRCV
jgi:hypothetical protein